MEDKMRSQEEIYSKSLRCGRRTYFFDVRATKAEDYYLTITEGKRYFSDDGAPYYKKHKIYLYKEDFKSFRENLEEITDYIIQEKGEEIINNKEIQDTSSEKFNKENSEDSVDSNKEELEKEENIDANQESEEEVNPEEDPNKNQKDNTDSKSKFTDVNFEDI